MIVFHGSTVVIKQPLVAAGRQRLDFGQGFYVTDIKQQAESWAERMQRIMIDTVEAYMANMMTLETALGELSKHKPNNQLCIAKQNVIDTCLVFVDSYNI